jgi:hypothetical protein
LHPDLATNPAAHQVPLRSDRDSHRLQRPAIIFVKSKRTLSDDSNPLLRLGCIE